MEIETWIDGPSSPIPSPLPLEFANQEIYPVGYMGVANSSRKGGINAKMNGKRVFGTIFHPYIVGGRFAWCNGVWFVLVCVKIPTIVLRLARYTPIVPREGNYLNRDASAIDIASANYFDSSIESQFAFLDSPYFAWVSANYKNNYYPDPYQLPYAPFTESNSIPAPYYETNLGVGSPVKKIGAGTLNSLKITGLNQLDFIEIYPSRYCWSESTPYFKNDERNWFNGIVDYFDASKLLAGFSFQETIPVGNDFLLYKFTLDPVSTGYFKVRETQENEYLLKTPKLPDPTWTGIKSTRNRSIDGFDFIEYAFEVKAQPCDIEITVDPALSPTGQDKFCLEYEDYNQLLNRFDNIEQKLNLLPP